MHISIVDDEVMLANRMQKKLENEGFAVSVFNSYKEFMRGGDGTSHLYIVDISLWDGSGFDIIEWLRIRAESKSPILIISGYGDSEKIIYGLTLGADDYMVKPLHPDELIARVKSLLRRGVELKMNTPIEYKSISYNPERKETHVGGTKVHLTHKESMILEIFIRNPGRVINREDIINTAWWWNQLADVTDNTINVTLSKLRKKIGSDLELKTIYNEWYLLD